jgi:hypothetical protein
VNNHSRSVVEVEIFDMHLSTRISSSFLLPRNLLYWTQLDRKVVKPTTKARVLSP